MRLQVLKVPLVGPYLQQPLPLSFPDGFINFRKQL
ncbi:hypothetical protein Vi05172_g7170 [Venturia inaequalis]|nr:hypothetical protein Vi05172_g7170 [Venturia inaequalis]